MLSRFYSTSRTLFSRSRSSSQTPNTETTAAQAQPETPDAIDDMVTTRGQQRQSDAKSLSDGLDLYHSLTGLKRKADDEGDGNRLDPANEKRRRYSAEGGPTEHASDDEFKERSQSAGVLNSQERDESQKLAIRSYEGAHLEGESSAAQAVTMTTEAPDFESGSLNISQESWANTKVTQSSSPRPGKSLVPVIYVDKKGFRPEQVDAQQAGEEPVAPELADTESAHTEPIITETVDTGSFSNEPTPVEPIDRSHDHTNTNDAELVDMKPVGTEQVTTESVNIEPTSAGPAKTAPDNFEPVDGDSTIQEPAETDFAVAGSIPLESRHKRFGSEDHVILETQLRETIATVDVNENSTKDELEEKEESSEDEAPETVTAAAGHDQARSVAVEAEKSVKQYVPDPAWRYDTDSPVGKSKLKKRNGVSVTWN